VVCSIAQPAANGLPSVSPVSWAPFFARNQAQSSDETAVVTRRIAVVTTDRRRRQMTTDETLRRAPITLVYSRSTHAAPLVGGYLPR